MAIKKVTFPCEVLFRFDENGYKASHLKHLTIVKDTKTGEIHSATESEPEDITKENAEALINSEIIATVEDIETAVALRTGELVQSLEIETKAHAEKTKQLEAANAQLLEAAAHIERVKSVVAGK